ncbi:MAG: hypothetical protein GY751_16285 [Bacteroidetes bacterium]|nr:hypothetical protein [Bacteroidota bacterium]
MKKYLFVMFYSAIVLILFISYLPNSDLVNAYAYTLYVKDDAAGNNDGSSWINAYTSLQTALENVSGGDEVWVAKGTYKPNYKTEPDDLRTSTFQLKNGVVIYGGFNGTESNIFERDWKANQTILSGNIGTNDEIADNCYHVVTGSNTDSTAVIDGFIITGGNADFTNGQGGGVFILNGSPIINNCTFNYNYAKFGGGMANINGSPALDNCTFSYNRARLGGGMADIYGSPTLTNCTFNANSADEEGGGIYNDSNNPRILNCTFSYNSADNGGGIYSYWYGNLAVTNCTFRGNTADSSGGGIYVNWYSSSRVINCTIVENAADNNNDGEGKGGGLYISEGSILTIKNTIIANNQKNSISDDCFNNNSTINSSGYNLAEYGCASDFNKTGDITDEQTKLNVGELTDNGGYTQTCALETESIAIDMGTDSGAPVTDQRGYGYERNGTTDIGAFEYSATPTVPVVVSVGMLSVGTDMASIGGYVTLDGGTSVTSRGVCWDTTPNPTIENSHTKDGAGTGIFTSSVTGLSPNTAYYMRVYATNSVGTSYGKENSFTTDVAIPSVTTAVINSVTATTAFGGGNVTSDGGASITARGVCWNTGQNPTIEGSHTTDGAGPGFFTSSITELTPGTTYYVRAYATNSEGTSYGENELFTTNVVTTPPTVTSTSPDDNATNVNADTVITAIFSESMDVSTITTTTFFVTDGSAYIAGIVIYSDTTATFTTSSVLEYGKTYKATITTGVKDLEGTSMQSDYTWVFTTVASSGFFVESTEPANNAVDVDVHMSIIVNFSKEMDVSTINENTFYVLPATGIVSYSDKIAMFTPSSSLESNKVYTAILTTGVKDIDGNSMTTNYIWSFTTVEEGGGPGPIPGSISGTVYNSNGNPITGDTIIVWATYNNPCGSYDIIKTSTNPVNGTYSMGLSAPNAYYLCTSNNGTAYLNECWASTASVIDCSGAESIILTTGTPDVANRNFQLDSESTISGTIYRSDGSTPFTGNSVRITAISGYPCGDREQVGDAYSDPSDGSYTIHWVSAGSYYLRIWLLENVEWWTSNGSVLDCSNAEALTVSAGESVVSKDFQFEALVLKGDINGDGNINLADAILVLKLLSGLEQASVYNWGEMINEDGKIGMEEAIYILQVVIGIRD